MTNKNSKLLNFKIVPLKAGYLNFGFCILHFNFKKGFTPLEVSPDVASGLPFRKRNGLLTGFTLIETVVALSVILAGVLGPVYLITKSISTGPFSKNKLTSLNLAQEGIELVREWRDNNVLCDIKGGKKWLWNADPDSPPGNPQTLSSNNYYFLTINNTTELNKGTCKTSEQITTPRFNTLTDANGKPLCFDGTFFTDCTAGSPTAFSRSVLIKNPPDNPDADNGAKASDQLDAISTVTWAEPNGRKTITLQERFYNWR